MLILYSTSIFAANSAISFPGKIDHISSPNNNYILYNADYDNPIDKFENNHSLFLLNTKNNNKQRIFNYGRHIDAQWSPDSNDLLITDYGGSDFADCLIFKVDNEKISITDVMKKGMPSNKEIFSNGHVYVTCSKWQDATNAIIYANGYGGSNPNGFESWYKYNLSTMHLTLCKNKECS